MLFHLYVLGKISKKKFLGTARVIAYGTVVAGVFGALSARNAVADVRSQSLELGRKLTGIQDLVSGSHEYRLNGQSVYVSASESTDAVKDVLDRFESHCKQSRGLAAPEWNALVASKDAPPEVASSDRFGIMRTEDHNAHDGVVMCFTRENGARNFVEAMQEFATTSDLHAFGDVRYVHAVREDNRTLVQTVWTDGSFKLDAISTQRTHDAPGADLPGIPRPLRSTRVMTAEAVGTPYSARVYTSTAPAKEVLDTYIGQMQAQGWMPVESPDFGFDHGHHADGRWFMRLETGEQFVVSVSKATADQPTTVIVGSVALMPKGGPVATTGVKPQ
ncbi:MAG TPA: hypothetical protein VGH28_01365 [Polyangiaceae bacterium]|jgi:hypothetical protein